jgi:hypothetical protein
VFGVLEDMAPVKIGMCMRYISDDYVFDISTFCLDSQLAKIWTSHIPARSVGIKMCHPNRLVGCRRPRSRLDVQPLTLSQLYALFDLEFRLNVLRRIALLISMFLTLYEHIKNTHNNFEWASYMRILHWLGEILRPYSKLESKQAIHGHFWERTLSFGWGGFNHLRLFCNE